MGEENSAKQEHLIFVSYAHENGGWIAALGLDKDPGGLENASFWVDRNQIHPSGPCGKLGNSSLRRNSNLCVEKTCNSATIPAFFRLDLLISDVLLCYRTFRTDH